MLKLQLADNARTWKLEGDEYERILPAEGKPLVDAQALMSEKYGPEKRKKSMKPSSYLELPDAADASEQDSQVPLPEGARRVAVIDLGSNSLRLL